MIEAWYMDNKTCDQRLPHKKDPNEPCELEHLKNLGVCYYKLDENDKEEDVKESFPFEFNKTLANIRKERGYTYHDVVNVSPKTLPGYEEKIKSFFEEHIHADEEVRLCLEGSGYFDVRTLDDKWIRCHVKKGDLLILPEGIYHRFTLDETNYIHALRLFIGAPIWTPYNRPCDEHKSRIKYLKDFTQSAA